MAKAGRFVIPGSVIFLMTLPAVLLLSAACSASDGGLSNPENPQKIRVILDYLPNTNHTGLYVALEKGYYRAEGLDVEIVQPSEGATATLIATGQGQFGVSYQEDVTYARTAEEALPIKAIAALVQHNTSGFATYAPKNIASPADFEGKVYSGWGSPAEEAIIRAVMRAAKADPDRLRIVSGGVSSGEGGFAALTKAVDIIWIFYGWAGIRAEYEGFPINYMELRTLDDRLDYYTPVIIAADKLLAENPELARKFLKATKQGYEDSVSDPDSAAGILAKHVPEYDPTYLKLSQAYLSPRYIDDAPRWGEMKTEVWDKYTAFMLEYGLITKKMIAEDGFTNQFLP
jgi:ABC-type nitrate/sulfonate/bicarbonate transport system substrate-binding protein